MIAAGLATLWRQARALAEVARLVARLAGPHRPLLYAAAGLALLTGVAEAAVPLIAVPLVAQLLGDGSALPALFAWPSGRLRAAGNSEQALLLGLVLMALAMIARQALLSAAKSLGFQASHRIVDHVRVLLLDSLFGASYGFLDGVKTGAVRQIVVGEAAKVIAAARALVDMAGAMLTVLLLLALLLALSPWLTGLMLAVALLAVPGKLAYSRAVHRAAEANLKASFSLMNRINEAMLGIRHLKLLNMQPLFHSSVQEASGVSERSARSVNLLELWEPTLVQAYALATIVFTLLLGRQLGLGPFERMIGFFFVVWRCVPAVEALSVALTRLLSARPGLLKVAEYLPLPAEATEARGGGRRAARPVERLAFEDVRFGYAAGKPVLDGVSLHASRGELVAVVGTSGAGKSSLLHLAVAMYPPWSGRITLDGVEIRELELASLRDHVGLVSQDVHLFNTSVREWIEAGRALSEPELQNALRAAAADDFVAELPRGLETRVGERGIRLSGGQRQRLLLAQLHARRPAVLLLDEATSALDLATERRVFDALEALRGEQVILLVTHRVANLTGFDRIYVLEAGHVVEAGRYQELLDRDGAFARLLRRERSAQLLASSNT